MPERIQLKRTKGWRLPPDTLKVDRSTAWGNPFRIERPQHSGRWKVHGPGVQEFGVICGNEEGAALVAVRLFRQHLMMNSAQLEAVKSQLRGKNLACWCRPDAPCHADVLLEVANG